MLQTIPRAVEYISIMVHPEGPIIGSSTRDVDADTTLQNSQSVYISGYLKNTFFFEERTDYLRRMTSCVGMRVASSD